MWKGDRGRLGNLLRIDRVAASVTLVTEDVRQKGLVNAARGATPREGAGRMKAIGGLSRCFESVIGRGIDPSRLYFPNRTRAKKALRWIVGGN